MRSTQILENIIPDMSNILRCIYKYEAQKICMKVNEEQKKLSFYQIKYILDYRSSYGHVGNRDTPITRKIETASFCAKLYKVLS